MEELTKYERARIIGARSLQLEWGAPPLISIEKMEDTIEIAERELETGVIPLVVVRV